MTHGLHRLVSRCCADASGLSLEQVLALSLTDQKGSGVAIGELATALSRTSHAVSSTVDNLEKRGLVARLRSRERDRRVVIVSVTDAGRRALQACRDRLARDFSQILHELAPAGDQVVASLRTINVSLRLSHRE